jgi:dTMP kinase
MTGRIIYFDGPDGVGKSTQLKMVAKVLRDEGHEVHATRTLGGTHIGEMLREVMLSENERPAATDLHIALACQHALAHDVIRRRQEGEIVLIDRSPLSIIGYQVFGDGLNKAAGFKATEELIELIRPDLIIVYDAPAEELENRRTQRNHDAGHDYFEVKPLAYHKKVAVGFKEAASKFGADVVKATDSIAGVHDHTMKFIDPLLKA